MTDDFDEVDENRVLEIVLTASQRGLIVDHAALEGEVRAVLEDPVPAGGRTAVSLPEEEWEAIAGDLSVAANRTNDRKLQRQLDGVIEMIEDALLIDEEDDEE